MDDSKSEHLLRCEDRARAVKGQIIAGKFNEHTLLGIAMDCGVISKASFNLAFKKHIGFTPTPFKSQHERKILIE